MEVEKEQADRGRYLHPELFNAPETARIGYLATGPVAAMERKEDNSPALITRVPVVRQGMIPPRPPVPKLPARAVAAKPNAAQASK